MKAGIGLSWLGFGLLIACGRAVSNGPSEASRSERLTNSVGMHMVAVAAGEFLMGSTEAPEHLVLFFASYQRQPQEFADEYPRHRVRISRPFLISTQEVTVGQFRRFVAETGYRTEAEVDGEGGWGYNPESRKCVGRRPRYGWQNPGYPQTDQHPVVNVSWNDAVAFCQWLSHQEGRTYRLPTEAEWEYANRAGSSTRYADGDDPSVLRGAARIIDPVQQPKFLHVQDLSIDQGDPSAFPLPVGSLRPNALGLSDTHGNVWEWVADWYGEDYYRVSPSEDPAGPVQGSVKVRRGGGWNSFPLWVRSSFRNWNTPSSRCVNLGFRVVTSG